MIKLSSADADVMAHALLMMMKKRRRRGGSGAGDVRTHVSLRPSASEI